MTVRDAQTGGQLAALDPQASAWVGANAGSGKTWVLASRVLRLLLAGVRPHRILCLTFTKTAAAEMATRILDELAKWSAAGDDDLRKALVERGYAPDGPEALARARGLFARTLDAPGGLQIQTIHAFCESLLKRFPLEAGVPPHFAVADDITQVELLRETRDRLLRAASGDTAIADALATVAAATGEMGFDALADEAIQRRRRLAALAGGDESALAAALAIAADANEDALAREFVAAAPLADLARAAKALTRGGVRDTARAALLTEIVAARDKAGCIDEQWARAFLTGTGEPLKTLAAKASLKADPGIATILEDEQARLIDFRARRDAIRLLRGSEAFLALARALNAIYAQVKRERGLLDYDDLILGARALLAGENAVPWVLFKLDGGIDHILVDEAQDTSAEQWDIVAALADEFFSGRGRREGIARTVFAVGDPKQSIFRFQGADPAQFARQRDRFAAQVQSVAAPWRLVPIETSRRSAPAILDFVDRLFALPEAQDGVVEAGRPLAHRAHRIDAFGMVELWPLIGAREEDDGAPWDAPLDYVDAKSPPAQLAGRIAETIKCWTARGEILESAGRPIQAGDVLILVRRRDAFFHAIVRALKQARIPVAGADRLVLAEEIAVMDLAAIGRFALLPQDDLTLATVLKGPLFGFSEEDLFALCHKRDSWLWNALRSRAGEQPHWACAADELSSILARADYVGPHDFFAEILAARGGRARILARLGPEAAEPLDEFLAQALAFEQLHPPALEAFLHWFAAAGAEIKRDPEPARAEVRVMTVHGAKGLEAPIVILPDTAGVPDHRHDPPVLWTAPADGTKPLPLWPGAGGRDHAASRAARDAERRAQRAEYRRLLYVAATRPRDRLYVCGWYRKEEPGPDSWYRLIERSFDTLDATTEVDLGWGKGRRFTAGTPAQARPQAPQTAVAPEAIPDWARRPAPDEPVPPRPLAPSRPRAAEPAATSPLADDGRRFRRGRLIHRLLQVLPDVAADQREQAAVRLLAGEALGAEERAEMTATALAVLADPAIAAAFGPDSLAEAPLVGRIGATVIAGQVDRLMVGAEILVIDYKTNRPPPLRVADVAPLYLGQMAAYRALLAGIYPGRPVRCCLLWTEGPRLMELPPTLLDAHAP